MTDILADTSVFIAAEQARPVAELPTMTAVSVITIGELRAGVLSAIDTRTRAARLDTLGTAQDLRALTVDVDVARAWASLRLVLRDTGRRLPMNDSWIAATAIAHGLAVATQDADYDGVPGLEVIRV